MSLETSVDLDPSVNYEQVYNLLEELFESSLNVGDTTDLFSNLSDLYDSFEGQGFEESFNKILLYILSESKRSTDVSRILRFISESIINLDNKYKTAAKKNGATEDVDDIVHPLLKHVFKTLIRWSHASSVVVRYRICQMLFMILTYIQDHGMGEIDMEIYENIAQLVESRRLDVSTNVRAHAVLLAKFFQDPTTVNDPVIEGLCWQMQYDPNPRVRQNIVSVIAACEETIMPIAKRFLYDKNANVRNAALLHICKRIGPRSFTPYQRVMILQQCFSDPSEIVRRNAEQKLVPVWFRACGDKLCNFFKYIRIGNETLEDLPFIKELTKVLSKCVKVSQIIEEIELDSTNNYLPKLPLSGEKVYLWRHFFTYSCKDQRLARFFPSLDVLIPFILKCFDDSSSEEVEISVFSELILFLMDIMEAMGILKCEEVFPVALNLMRHPFVHHELMPYLVTLYLTYSPKEKEYVHKDILEVVADLLRLIMFTQGQEKNILLKCFAIASQVLLDESSLTSSIRSIKDNLIVHHLNDEDEDLKINAISTLVLYCLLDIKEAKLSWDTFEEALQVDSGPLRYILLEGAFDILKCYGAKLFENLTDDGQDKFNETLRDMLECIEDGETEQEIVIRGILKIYMEQQCLSPSILANLVLLLFQENDYDLAKSEIEDFFIKFGEFKEGSNCLIKSFLAVINILYDANKNSPLYKINIKSVALKLMEYAKTFEEHRSHSEEKFQNLLVLKLTKKFIKKPWKLSASDLYTICSKVFPKKFETLLKLKDNIIQIRENLHSSIFQQKNPYTKKTEKNFAIYQKKIQIAMNNTPLIEEPSKEIKSPVLKKLNFDSSLSSKDDSLLRESNIAVDTSPDTGNLSNDQRSFQLPLEKRASLQPVKIFIDSAHSSPVQTPLKNSEGGETSPLKKNITPSPAPRSSRTKTPSFEKTMDSSLSVQKSQVRRSSRKTKNSTNVTPLPSDTITPISNSRKIATASKTRSTRRTAALIAEEDSSASPVFKTPAPRKTPSRKRQLDISITKT